MCVSFVICLLFYFKCRRSHIRRRHRSVSQKSFSLSCNRLVGRPFYVVVCHTLYASNCTNIQTTHRYLHICVSVASVCVWPVDNIIWLLSIGNMSESCWHSRVCVRSSYVLLFCLCQYKIFYFESRQREALNPIGAFLRAANSFRQISIP